MATTYTSIWRLAVLSTGDPATNNTWGVVQDATMPLMEQGAVGITAVNINGLATYSLTTANNATDQARFLVQQYTGALAATCTVTIPNLARIGWAQNNTTGGQNVVLSAGGTTAPILPNGQWYLFSCDGATNVALVPIGFVATSATIPTLNGNVAVGGSLTTGTTLTAGTGLTVTAGGLTVSAGGVAVAGNVTLSGTGNLTASGVVTANGVAVSIPINGASYSSAGGGGVPFSGATVNYGVTTNSNMLSAGFVAFSDKRLKTDIREISEDEGIAWIRKARPVHYLKDGHPELGFLAQDQAIAGYSVILKEDPRVEEMTEGGVTFPAGISLMLRYDDFHAYETAAIKSLLRMIDELSARISAIEAREG